MAISEITGQGGLHQPSRAKKKKESIESSSVGSDKAQVSSEAKALLEASYQQRVEEIQRRIREKFYARHDVTEKVVDAVIRDLMK